MNLSFSLDKTPQVRSLPPLQNSSSVPQTRVFGMGANKKSPADELAECLAIRCVAGDTIPLVNVIKDYEKRISELERENVSRLTAVMESESLRRNLSKEKIVATETKRQLEVMIFRSTYDLNCKLTEDSVPDNGALTIDQQAQVIIKSLELPDVPSRSVETDEFDSRAEAVSALHNQFIHVRDTAKQIKSALQAQVVERLHIKRALDKAHAARTLIEKEVEEARQGVRVERAAREKITSELRGEVKKAKDRVAKLEQQLFTEIEALRKSAQEREGKLEQENQKMAEELERLRTVERRLLHTDSELEQARKTSQELRTALADETKKVVSAAGAVRSTVLKELKKCSAQFDALPLEMKMGSLIAGSTPTTQPPVAASAKSMPSHSLTADLDEHFLALMAVISYMTKLLEEKGTEDVMMRVRAERDRLKEISDLRKQVNAHLFRMDVSELGDDIDNAVSEFAIIEKKLKKMRNSVRRSVTLGSPELADVAGVIDDELENAEERHFRVADEHGMSGGSQLENSSVDVLLGVSSQQQHGLSQGGFTARELQLFSEELHRVMPDLRASLTEAQISMLFERQASNGAAPHDGELSNMDSAARSSVLAGHSSLVAAKGRRRPTATEAVANLQHRMSTAGLNASMLLGEPGKLGELSPWFPLSASCPQSIGEASLHSGVDSVSTTLNIDAVNDAGGDAAARRKTTVSMILPPIRSVAKETATARSTMFGDVATIAAEIAAARNKEASDVLQATDEQRILNLKTCLAVLDNAQKQYAKSRGITLPPLDSLPPIDEESEIGRPLARGTGGAMTGKLWRATVQRQADDAAEARKKRKQSVKLSVKATAAPKR
jgi:hypothetical protein